MLVLPESWNVPSGSRYLVEDTFSGTPSETTGISENLLAGKLMAVEGEKTELIEQLQVQKNMTQTALEELLKAREELRRRKPSCCRRRRPPSRRRISSTVASAKRMSLTDSRGDAHVGSFVPPR